MKEFESLTQIDIMKEYKRLLVIISLLLMKKVNVSESNLRNIIFNRQ